MKIQECKIRHLALLVGYLFMTQVAVYASGNGATSSVVSELAPATEVGQLKSDLSEKQLKKLIPSLVKLLDEPSYFQKRVDQLQKYDGKEAHQVLADLKMVLSIQDEYKGVSFRGAEITLQNIKKQFPKDGSFAGKYLAKLKKYEKHIPQIKPRIYQNDKSAINEIRSFLNVHRKTMLQNPLLKNKEIYAIRQIVKDANTAMGAQIGRNRNNWTSNASMKRKGWNNEICKLSDLQDDVKLSTIYKPEKDYPVKDIDLNWDGNRLMFSAIGDHERWHVYELDGSTNETKRLTPNHLEDIDFFDPCYLPDGRIVLSTTASYSAVPCVGGNSPASDIFLMDPKDQKLRQLNFGQETEWNPVILHSGKVCYLRWEYTDNSHYFTRILMSMNPDGTNKKEYYGSGSYFPNSLFDVRPIPDHPTEFIGIVSGHHGIARSGRLMIFDPTKGRKEADGVVQEIPGYGKTVEPIIKDQLVNGVWPQFLNPYPLSKDYFLVSAKMGPNALWGIYLVDRFDNMTLVYHHQGEAFTEPVVIEKREVPPVIPDRVNLGDKNSTVYITDIYEGQGLKGIPRGTVKKLRIYAYQYAYHETGGHDYIGLEAGWDVKRILGTVPVEEDGSAMFKIPANTPVALHPLDENGAALQIMRSWMTGMPGEVVSCVGCHESQNMVPPAKQTIASRKQPALIKSWYGPTRPVSYNTELKPVIEKRCVGCHNGVEEGLPDFSSDKDAGYHGFSKSYMALHPYVRRPGCESDFKTLEPMDYYANTSELVQMLRKGHYGVKLDDEEWDRLITWIDLNVPYHGKFTTKEYNDHDQVKRRDELARCFANVSPIGEKELERAEAALKAKGPIEPVMPKPVCKKPAEQLTVDGWPFDSNTAKELQKKAAVDGAITKTVDLGGGVKLDFVRIPSGKYIIGDNDGQPDQKECIVNIEKPFWMSKTEITNEMFRTIFKEHNSRHIDQQWKDHIFAGYPANNDEQPAIRMTWNQANEFCQKLSDKTGLNIDLPTEAQWEWAARSGSNSEMYFGGIDDDFSSFENLADYTLRDLAVVGVNPRPMKPQGKRFEVYNFVPKTEKYNDGVLVPEGTGKYKSNAWGLYDMLGNVAEWTRTDYSRTGYNGDKVEGSQLKVAKGGSWRDRPKYSTAATRDGYFPFQKVFNVGFRVVITD